MIKTLNALKVRSKNLKTQADEVRRQAATRPTSNAQIEKGLMVKHLPLSNKTTKFTTASHGVSIVPWADSKGRWFGLWVMSKGNQ